MWHHICILEKNRVPYLYIWRSLVTKTYKLAAVHKTSHYNTQKQAINTTSFSSAPVSCQFTLVTSSNTAAHLKHCIIAHTVSSTVLPVSFKNAQSQHSCNILTTLLKTLYIEAQQLRLFPCYFECTYIYDCIRCVMLIKLRKPICSLCEFMHLYIELYFVLTFNETRMWSYCKEVLNIGTHRQGVQHDNHQTQTVD